MCHFPPRFREGTRVRVTRHGSDPRYAKEGVVVQMFGGADCGVFDVVFDGDDYRSTCSEWDTVETIRDKEVPIAEGKEGRAVESVVAEGPHETEVDLRSLLQEAWRRRGGV